MYPIRNSIHKLYFDQDRRLITLVMSQQHTRFGFRDNVVSVIARYLNELTVNITFVLLKI